jgi:hypothetical protein
VIGLQLVQGGDTYKGGDIEILWQANIDEWHIDEYRINIIHTGTGFPLNTKAVSVYNLRSSYTLRENIEDNAGTPVDDITFEVIAVGPGGESPNAAVLEVTSAIPVTPSTLALVGGGTFFEGKNVELEWDMVDDLNWITKYKLEIINPLFPGVVVRTANMPSDHNYYDYTFFKNIRDNGVAIKSVTARLYNINVFGIESASYDSLAVTSTIPPDVTNLQIEGGGTEWTGIDCFIEWDDMQSDTNPVKFYRVWVYKASDDPEEDDPLFVTTVSPDRSSFAYTFEQNREDNINATPSAPPVSSLKFLVECADWYGQFSDSRTLLTATIVSLATPTGLIVKGDANPGAFTGRDCYIEWDDMYGSSERVMAYEIKVYRSNGTTLLDTRYKGIDRPHFTYDYEDNKEDNYLADPSTSPINIIKFEVKAVDYFYNFSSAATLTATNVVPSNIANTTAYPFIGGVRFAWTGNANNDFDHYKYRFDVGGDGYPAEYFTKKGITAQRLLTDTEKIAHGYNATITIQVLAVDTFGSESSAVGTANEDCMPSVVDLSELDDAIFEDTRVANAILLNSVLTIRRVAEFNSILGNQDGAIKITLPQSWTDTLLKFIIDINNSNSDGSFSLELGGKNALAFGGQWHYTSAKLRGSIANNNRVRFGHDGTKCCIVIGDIGDTGVWDYLKIIIRDFTAGHNLYAVDVWDDGWNIALITSESGITFSDTDFTDALLDAATIIDQKALATLDMIDIDASGITNDEDWDQTSGSPQNLSWLIGSSGSLTISAAGTLKISSAGGLSIESGGVLQIKALGGIEVQSGANISLLGGGDLILEPDNDSPSKIIFRDAVASNDISFSRSSTNDYLQINPDNDDSCILGIGFDYAGALRRWSEIYLAATDHMYLATYVGPNDNAFLLMDVTVGVQLKSEVSGDEAYVTCNGSTGTSYLHGGGKQIQIDSSGFYPTTDSVCALGLTGKRWSAIWGDALTIGGDIKIDNGGLKLTPLSSAPSPAITGMIVCADTTWDPDGVGRNTIVFYDGSVWRRVG